MSRILKVSIILPYYEARYVINKKIEIKSDSGNTLIDEYENKIVKEIKFEEIGCDDYSYVVFTEDNKMIYINEKQPGLQIVKEIDE